MSVDKVDRKIISELVKNAKVSARALARKVGIHHNTILKRLRRLEAKGIIRGYRTHVDFSQVGYGTNIVIMIKLRGGTFDGENGLDGIAHMHELEAMYLTTGLWDVLSFWRVKDEQHYEDLMRKIDSHPVVLKADSHIVSCAHTTHNLKFPNLFDKEE